MTSIKVSIIVAVYNSEPFLRACIESALNQTLREIELILVIDGSPDNSYLICEEYAQRDPRVRVLYQENQGAGYAFRNGHLNAHGEYLLYMDADDWINLDTCRIAYEEAISTDADVVLWPFINEFDSYSKPENLIFKEKIEFVGQDMAKLRRRMVGLWREELRNPTRTDAIVSMWAKLYKRSVIVDNDVSSADKQGRLNFDVFFNVKAFFYAKRALYIPIYLTHYRRGNPNSVTKNWGMRLFTRYLSLFEAIEDFMEEKCLPADFREALNNRIAMSTINVVLTICSPRNKDSAKDKLANIRKVIEIPKYREAYQNLNFRYLPLHWKVFFLLAKWRLSLGIYLMGKIMQRLK